MGVLFSRNPGDTRDIFRSAPMIGGNFAHKKAKELLERPTIDRARYDLASRKAGIDFRAVVRAATFLRESKSRV